MATTCPAFTLSPAFTVTLIITPGSGELTGFPSPAATAFLGSSGITGAFASDGANATGIGAAAVHIGVQWLTGDFALTVGASGAIYGILMGYAMLYPDSVLTLMFPPVSMKAKWFVLIFAGLELLLGITGTQAGVAHFAHLGGLIFGFALIWFWKKRHRLYSRWD